MIIRTVVAMLCVISLTACTGGSSKITSIPGSTVQPEQEQEEEEVVEEEEEGNESKPYFYERGSFIAGLTQDPVAGFFSDSVSFQTTAILESGAEKEVQVTLSAVNQVLGLRFNYLNDKLAIEVLDGACPSISISQITDAQVTNLYVQAQTSSPDSVTSVSEGEMKQLGQLENGEYEFLGTNENICIHGFLTRIAFMTNGYMILYEIPKDELVELTVQTDLRDLYQIRQRN